MNKLLLCTDLSAESKRAFSYARALAKKGSAEVTLLAVVEDLQPTSITFEFGIAPIDAAGIMEQAVKRAGEELIKIKDGEFTGISARTAVVEGYRPVAREITEYAREHGFHAIILATHGRTGIAHALLGSVAEQVVRGAPCPVFVIPAAEETPEQLTGNLILLSDLSDEALKLLPYGKALAPHFQENGGQFTILHIVEDVIAGTFDFSIGVGAEQIWGEQQEKLTAKLNRLITERLSSERVLTAILRQERTVAEDICHYAKSHHGGLLVMGTHGRTGFNRLVVGSVAEQVVRLSRCPVLVVPVEGGE